jgi:cysteine desulfurase
VSGPASVYLDYAATAPVDPRVAEVMAECLRGPAGNPSSVHPGGRRARARVERARAQVAALVSAAPAAIVFTSGATESDNLGVLGAARAARDRGRHVVTSRTEHRAVLDACRRLEREGFEVTWLRPGVDGRVLAEQVAEALRPDTVLVALMHANNETGVVNEIPEIGRLCRGRGVLLHVDAAQTAGRIPVDVETLGADLVAFTAHKLGGPAGIGALYVRREPRPALDPLLFGGGQEGGLRPGTLATHQPVGFGLACEIAAAALPVEEPRVRALRERLWSRLAVLDRVERNGAAEPSVPGILNVFFAGVEGESLLLELEGIVEASSGSACSSARAEPSYVLRALGRSDAAAQASLRLSLGRFTTAEEVDRAAAALVAAVRRLRALAPEGAMERVA